MWRVLDAGLTRTAHAVRSPIPKVARPMANTAAPASTRRISLFGSVRPRPMEARKNPPDINRAATATPLNDGERPTTATVRTATQEFTVRVRLDTDRDAAYYRHGGITPYVLRRILESESVRRA